MLFQPSPISPSPVQRAKTLHMQKRRFLDGCYRSGWSKIVQHHTPTFIHAHQSPLHPNTPATIVQVRHCQVEVDGRVDVLIEPIAYIWLEQIWTRPGTGGLIEARGVRMEKDTSDRYEMWCAMSAFGRGDGRGWGQMLPIP